MRKLYGILALLAVLATGCGISDASKKEVIRPAYLKEGDSIGIMTLSSALSESTIRKADTLIDVVRSWGLKVKLGESLLKRDAVPLNLDRMCHPE